MAEIFKIVKDKKKGFTVVPNQLAFDENISLKSTMLLIIMLALPPSWDLTLKGLATLKKDGLDSIRTGINELEKAGYIIKKRIRNELGQVKGTEYTVYETLDLNPEYNKSIASEVSDKANKSLPVDLLSEDNENTLKKPELDFPIQADTAKFGTPKLDFPIQADMAKIDTPKLDFPKQENPTQLNTKYIKNYINNQSINQDNINNININTYRCDDFDTIDEIDIKNRIDYEKLKNEFNEKQLDNIVGLMAETFRTEKEKIRIAGENLEAKRVKEQFAMLTENHIRYVLECVAGSTGIRNIRQYLLTSLYNAPVTMESYYAARERPDKPDRESEAERSYDLNEMKMFVNNFPDISP